MMIAKIKDCTCASKYQDERYGPGKRVMNFCKDRKTLRCTVCGNKH